MVPTCHQRIHGTNFVTGKFMVAILATSGHLVSKVNTSKLMV
jgi:hypothetical protein